MNLKVGLTTAQLLKVKKRETHKLPIVKVVKLKTLVVQTLGKKVIQKTTNKKTIASNINKIKIVEDNFDYVGDQFTEEAKK